MISAMFFSTASVVRHIYLRQGVGVGALQKVYGGKYCLVHVLQVARLCCVLYLFRIIECYDCSSVVPLLKDHPMVHDKSGLSREVVFDWGRCGLEVVCVTIA